MSGARHLVIVESPAKAKTIGKYLGPEYEVMASVGHIRDLPQPSELPADMKKGPYGKFAVDVDHGFDPYYVVSPEKKKTVADLKRAMKDADALYLATDEDREGEAIAWHLLETLKPKKSLPVYRMVFHEITKEAIQRAVTQTREVDTDLVNAQETRRILDRLYGYEVSPVLWRKVKQGLSAGRVQSVATRLVVERERERMAFVEAGYWDLTGTFTTQGDESFTARLTGLDGQRIATGKDFRDDGSLKRKNVVVLDESRAKLLVPAFSESPVTVASVEDKPYTRRPTAPFTTSSLQQEASRKLHMGARQTMRVAQGLYENGYITYMRTDSVVLSGEAVSAARRQATELYGSEYVPDRPRVYSGRSRNAQEAHEAIRPAGDHFRTPAQVASQLSSDEFRLYELIWKRTVASQMADAKGSTSSIRLAVTGTVEGEDGPTTGEFSASGTVITFQGFLAAYEEGRDHARYSDDDGSGARLPRLVKDQALTGSDYRPDGHVTSPPPRYTEASLVRALEERGIGRPSTYAATISVIQDRGYVHHRGTALVPSWLAFAVIRLLEEHFGHLVDYDFTADMEQSLDEVASGKLEAKRWLERFYFGTGADEDRPGLKAVVDNLGDIDARSINSIPIGDGIVLRTGRYGAYLEAEQVNPETGEVTGDPVRASIPDDIAPDELTVDKAREVLARQADDGRVLGTDPETGHEIIAKDGRYGPYVTEVLPKPAEDEKPAQAATGTGTAKKSTRTSKTKKAAGPKPRTASLLKSMDLSTVTLDDALLLLSFPKVIGHGLDGEDITVQNGRYGPYLKKGSDSRSLASEDQLLTITEDEARAILAQPKRGRGATAKPPLKELGTDPVSEKPIVVKDGRFGPYITDGATNVTLRKDDVIDQLTHEVAAERLAEKRAKGPAKRRTSSTTKRKAAPKKKTGSSKK